jgi:1-acyl-sn-glycerol-3-phosphate acyltransferase
MLFPEGTRNKTNDPLLDFHTGAFRIAVEAQIPVAPLILLNTRKLMPKGGLLQRPGRMTCQYLDPVETKGMEEKDIPKLKALVREKMWAAILKFDPYFQKLKEVV